MWISASLKMPNHLSIAEKPPQTLDTHRSSSLFIYSGTQVLRFQQIPAYLGVKTTESRDLTSEYQGSSGSMLIPPPHTPAIRKCNPMHQGESHLKSAGSTAKWALVDHEARLPPPPPKCFWTSLQWLPHRRDHQSLRNFHSSVARFFSGRGRNAEKSFCLK